MLTKYLSVFFISMVPLIELRGAIPVGVAMGLPLWQVYVIAIIGNMLPIPFIIVYIRRIFHWMRRRSPRLNALVDKLQERGIPRRRGGSLLLLHGLASFRSN